MVIRFLRGCFLINFCNDPAIGFVSHLLGDGPSWSWTLTTQLGELLNEAETRYGKRDLEYTILGIEFGGDRPMIWYPGNRKQVSVRLSLNAKCDFYQAYFQLAHEVVHLLSPTGGGGTIVLEEGLAHLFSTEMSDTNGTHYNATIPAYDRAANLLRPLLSSYPDFIRDVRQIEPCMAKITPEHLISVFPSGDKSVFNALCEPFQDS